MVMDFRFGNWNISSILGSIAANEAVSYEPAYDPLT